MSFASGIALAIAAVLGSSQSPHILIESMPKAQTVEQYVHTYFADEPIMIKIAECESHFNQYSKNGSVHRGVVNNLDVGVMQVNEHYHSTTADKLGLDLYTIQGNVAYARYLYDTQGTAPWISSKPCWGKTETTLALAK